MQVAKPPRNAFQLCQPRVGPLLDRPAIPPGGLAQERFLEQMSRVRARGLLPGLQASPRVRGQTEQNRSSLQKSRGALPL